MTQCPGCYDSFSGPWCDNCDTWPCICTNDDDTPPTPATYAQTERATEAGGGHHGQGEQRPT